MIFNLSQGGVAFANVTAPSGASITASCQGLTVSGAGTCVLELPIIGQWTITCVFSGITKTSSVTVVSYGSSYSVTFTYIVPLTVSTFPNAAVTASLSGQADVTGTADANGSLTLNLTALGAWTVTADNGSVTEAGTVTVDTYADTPSISVLRDVPSITVVIGDDTYTYTGAEIDEPSLYISEYSSGWKFYMKDTGTVTFNFLTTDVDICAIGNGGDGGNRRNEGDSHYGGGGGSGGEMITASQQSLTSGTQYAITVSTSSVSFGSIAQPRNGNDASGAVPGAAVGTSPAGGNGGYYDDRSQYFYGPSGDGNGIYAFNDSTFDGVAYCNGGGGGHTAAEGGGISGTVYSSYGSGGAGQGQNYSFATEGIQGVVIMRNAA